jgi:heme exporter protein A
MAAQVVRRAEAAPAPVVRAREVTYLAGGRFLARGISLDVAAGEVVGLVGPNGAGKTTLLRLLGRLLKPSAGRLEWFGAAADELRDGHRIGFMGHETYLYGHLTARENLLYYAVLAGVRERSGEVARRLGRVGLEGVADAPVRSFSRGMAQRLSLARALLGGPRLLLLDEPESGLDRNARGVLADVLAEARSGDQAVVWSGHDLAFVLGHSDRAMLLDRGRAVHVGAAGEASLAAFAERFPAASGILPARALGQR